MCGVFLFFGFDEGWVCVYLGEGLFFFAGVGRQGQGGGVLLTLCLSFQF